MEVSWFIYLKVSSQLHNGQKPSSSWIEATCTGVLSCQDNPPFLLPPPPAPPSNLLLYFLLEGVTNASVVTETFGLWKSQNSYFTGKLETSKPKLIAICSLKASNSPATTSGNRCYCCWCYYTRCYGRGAGRFATCIESSPIPSVGTTYLDTYVHTFWFWPDLPWMWRRWLAAPFPC